MPRTSLDDVIRVFRQYCHDEFREALIELSGKLASGRKIKIPVPSWSPQEAAVNVPAARHSADFRSVNWFGHQYAFTGTQAQAVRVLWEAWEHGTPDVGVATLLEAADSDSNRFTDMFRNHPAMGTMIISTTKGLYRLAEPQ